MIFITAAEKYIAKIIFKNCIYKYKGQQFEDFFVSLMCTADVDFQPVKAYGNIGDRKNDGFNQITGTFYQVYGPENIANGKTIDDGVKKLEKDFTGLFEYWNKICKIENYYFVLNDKYEGVPSPIIEKAIELNNDLKYNGVNIALFTAKDLEKVFDNLNEILMTEVIGYFPKETMPIIEFGALHETVEYLLNTDLQNEYTESLVVPNFDEKIQFNGLSTVVSNQLTTGSYQEGLLTQYFNENPGINEILQKIFHSLYENSKTEVTELQDNYADRRFYYILDNACSKKTLPIQTSVLVLMAHYFSSCDIFEEPQ